jgi:hypothetical protein
MDAGIHLDGKEPNAKAFPMPMNYHASKLIRKDLEAAGIELADAAKRIPDFHCLRYTFCTNLARAGVHLRTAQGLMRRSAVNLTSRVYTAMGLETDIEALEKQFDLDAPAIVEQQSEELAATGTEGNSRLTSCLTRQV